MRKLIFILGLTVICSQNIFAQSHAKEEKTLPFKDKIAVNAKNDGLFIRADNQTNEVGIMCTQKTSEVKEIQYSIANLQGQVLLDGKLEGCKDDIYITALPYGEYVLRIADKNTVIATQKIVKQ